MIRLRSIDTQCLRVGLILAAGCLNASVRGQSVPTFLEPYRSRVLHHDGVMRLPKPPSIRRPATGADCIELASVPPHPWWQDRVGAPLTTSDPTTGGRANHGLAIGLEELIDVALSASPNVAAILTRPQMMRREIEIADSEFDTTTFLDARLADSSDPIGNQLVTGDASTRFLDQTVDSGAGFRRRSRYGGGVELAQRAGFQRNNSTFLLPNPQSTTRMELNFTQPLARDRGRAVNQTKIVLARLEAGVAGQQARDEIEAHLLKVAEAYWRLYESRCEYLQRARSAALAAALVETLHARDGIDADRRRILRAEVALRRRQSALVRIGTRIRNAQSRLRNLTGDPRLAQTDRLEVLPIDVADPVPLTIDRRDAGLVALQQRADIAAAIARIRARSVSAAAARNQLLPRLDLILSGYVAGLDGNSNSFNSIGNSFGNQFVTGRPSVAAGMLFELPWGNRAANARVARERLELNRTIFQFRQTTEDALTEVDIAVREVETTAAEIEARRRSIAAASREVDYLSRRLELLPDPGESVIVLMDDLLNAQSRLADEEYDHTVAATRHAIAHLQLRRVTGTLVQLTPGGAAVAAIEPSFRKASVETSTLNEETSTLNEPGRDDWATDPNGRGMVGTTGLGMIDVEVLR